MRDEVVLAVTLLAAVLFFLSYVNLCGAVGGWLNYIIFGLTGIFGYLFPFLLFFGVAFRIANRGSRAAMRKIICVLVFFLCVGSLMELGGGYDPELKWTGYFVASAEGRSGGGILGGTPVFLLCPLFDTVATAVILVAAMLISLMLLTGRELFAYLSRLTRDTVQERRLMAAERQECRAREMEEYEIEEDELSGRKARVITFQRGELEDFPEHQRKKNTAEEPIRFVDALKARGKKNAQAEQQSQPEQTESAKTDQASSFAEPEEAWRGEELPDITISGTYEKEEKSFFEEELRRKFGEQSTVSGFSEYRGEVPESPVQLKDKKEHEARAFYDVNVAAGTGVPLLVRTEWPDASVGQGGETETILDQGTKFGLLSDVFGQQTGAAGEAGPAEQPEQMKMTESRPGAAAVFESGRNAKPAGAAAEVSVQEPQIRQAQPQGSPVQPDAFGQVPGLFAGEKSEEKSVLEEFAQEEYLLKESDSEKAAFEKLILEKSISNETVLEKSGSEEAAYEESAPERTGAEIVSGLLFDGESQKTGDLTEEEGRTAGAYGGDCGQTAEALAAGSGQATASQSTGFGKTTSAQNAGYGPAAASQSTGFGQTTAAQNAGYGPAAASQSTGYGPAALAQNAGYGPAATVQSAGFGQPSEVQAEGMAEAADAGFAQTLPAGEGAMRHNAASHAGVPSSGGHGAGSNSGGGSSPVSVAEIAGQIELPPAEEKKYEFPPIELLAKPKPSKGANERELKETAVKLQKTLESFGVRVTVTNICCGPSVTQFELQPEQGVKVSQITKLSDDIKLNLAAADIRIEAPIPGKAAVGIEVPNKENTAVILRELLESTEFTEHKSNVAFAVGKNISGQIIVSDIAKMPHMLIAGATGSGKSVCINTIIMSILYKADPKDVKLIMVDPKVVELSIYNGIPHLLIPVVTDPKKASAALNWAVMEMTDRYNKFAELGVRDLNGYNEKVAAFEEPNPAYPRLPQIVIIVDELADLMMVASANEVEDAICRLAQMARAAGLHLIIATQRPSVNVITGVIKANVPSRIAFAVTSAVDSRTILDGVGAERLLGKGDMLFFPSGYPKPVRVQGAFVSDSEVSAVVDFLKEQAEGAPSYNEEVQKRIMTASSAEGGNGSADDKDDYFIEAGRYIIEKQKASIGMLQRLYKIGFNRAARIMDQLTAAGVVGPEEGTKPRKILMTMEEFEDQIAGGQ